MNPFEQYFLRNPGRPIDKWMHYFEAYHRHFEQFRGKRVVVLEVGVFRGGSLQMWKEYFGQGAQIFGVDIDPRCKEFEEEQIRVIIGSQSDREFLRSLKNNLPPVDILIDDGGHTMDQQISTFEELYPHVKDGGVYACEDLHTSYRLTFGGGVRRRGTFVEMSKHLIDQLNAWHSEQPGRLAESPFTSSTDSLHFYDSLLIIEKQRRGRPIRARTPGAESETDRTEPIRPGRTRLRVVLLRRLNRGLRFFRLPWVWHRSLR